MMGILSPISGNVGRSTINLVLSLSEKYGEMERIGRSAFDRPFPLEKRQSHRITTSEADLKVVNVLSSSSLVVDESSHSSGHCSATSSLPYRCLKRDSVTRSLPRSQWDKWMLSSPLCSQSPEADPRKRLLSTTFLL